MREDLFLGVDFEPLSKPMWNIIAQSFSESAFLKGPAYSVSGTSSCEAKGPFPLVRTFEKIGLGIRTQLEYFHLEVRIAQLTSWSAPA